MAVTARRIRLAVVAIAAVSTMPSVASSRAPPPEISAMPVALLVDLGSGQTLYQRNANMRFLPASMTKVMTAYVAFEEMRRGSLRRDQRFGVREETARERNGKGTSMYLEQGEQVSVDSLIHGIMTASANDASIVLAEGYAGSTKGWAFLMNDAASRLGMTGSRFATANGWPDEGRTFVTARDLVRLGSAMIRDFPRDYARYSGRKSFKWNDRMLFSRDPVTGVIEGADGIKTGFTQEAGYNFLGSAERDGRRLVMVVGGARSEAQRASASRALLEWGFAEWRARPLFAAGATISHARVQGGDAGKVALISRFPVHATLQSGAEQQIRLRIVYRGPVPAPIVKGQRIAELEVRVGDLPPGRIPLVAEEAVGKGGTMDRLVNGFKNLFS